MGDGRNTGAGEGREPGCLSKSEEGGCDLSGTKKPVLKNSRNSLCPKLKIFLFCQDKDPECQELEVGWKS